VAASLQSTGRSIDFVGRYGGEEFVMIAPGTWSADALVLGERLRSEIEQGVHVGRGDLELRVTISIGVAGYPEHGQYAGLLLSRADEALYVSKEFGRNRVTLWQTAING